MNSTSIHSLNADKGLNLPQKSLWFLFNWLNNSLFPNAKIESLIVRDFGAELSEENWSRTDPKVSPSRKLSDLFWLQLPWEAIKSELGPLYLLDTGCGSGNYGVKLQAYSEGNLAGYTGIDVSQHENWNALAKAHPNFQFFRRDSADISNYISADTNLFISQSAIEHFEQDLLYFEQISGFAKSTSRNIIQIHLFPSAACLKLYLLHGVRQYTPRTISKIVRLFDGFSYSRLYRLGGRECNRLHWEYIIRPLIFQKTGNLREIQAEEYDRRLRQAIAADRTQRHADPSFYALVIHSNWKEMIFK